MKDESIEIIKKHFCLNSEKVKKGTNIIGYNEQLKDGIMLFELYKSLIIYSDSNIFQILKKKRKIGIERATDLISMKAEIKEIEDERYYFIDEDTDWNPIDKSDLKIKDLTEKDESKIRTLKKKCTQNELDLGQVNLNDLMPIGGYIGSKLVGVASILEINENIYDIGVIVDPEYRNNSIGSALATHLIGYSIVKKKVARYLTNVNNKSSVGIAEKLKLPLIVKYRKITLKK